MRRASGNTSSTRPCLPLSPASRPRLAAASASLVRPVMTWTRSPFLIFIFAMSQHLRCQRDDLHVAPVAQLAADRRSEEHTSELQSRFDLVCRLLLEKKKQDDDNKVGFADDSGTDIIAEWNQETT